MRLIADTHAHTIASGHCIQFFERNGICSIKNGLGSIIFDRTCTSNAGILSGDLFRNFNVIPREMHGVKLLLGTELNIMNPDGDLDLSESLCRNLDIVIASIHSPCYGLDHTREENTKAYTAVMKKPYVDIIGHPDDGRFPVDYEVLVQTAKETKTLLEINNSSLRPDGFRKNTRENVLQMLELCKQYEVCVTTGSDAHIDVDAGNFSYIKEVLEFCKFPEELVVTTDLIN